MLAEAAIPAFLPPLKSFVSIFLALAVTFSVAEDSSPAPVETVSAIPTSDLAPELVLTGTVVSKRRARLSTRAEGLVEKVLVDAGSTVKEGELLMQLDTRLAEIELDLVRTEIEAAQVQVEEAERKREEVRGLTERGAFAKSEAESLDTTMRIRKAELAALKVREEQQLEQIERHQLVAPFSGAIARKAAEAGEWVDTGAMVLELVETDALWFELQVAQEFLSTVGPSTTATLTLDADPQRTFAARVDVVVPVKDPVSRTFLTRLTFEDPDGFASPGMSGSAALRVDAGDSDSVTVPRDAVMRYPDGTAKVWMVRQEDGVPVAQSVTVSTVASLGKTVEVTEGLKGGEQVIVRGNEGLSEGQRVAPREAQKTKGIDGL